MGIISISDPIDDFDVTDAEDGSRSYTTTHLVLSNDPSDTAAELYASALCPQNHLTTAPWDAAVTCRDRKFSQQEDPTAWLLTITWSSKQSFEKADENPLARPVVGSIRCEDTDIPSSVDANGRVMANAAGDLYRGLTVVANLPRVGVTACLENWPVGLVKLNNTVNASAVRILGTWFPARTCWMKNLFIPDKPEEENSLRYWKVTYDIVINERGYYELYPNSGLNRIQYQVRDNASADWEDVPFSEYDDKTPTTDRRMQRRRCLDGVGNDSGEETWLDAHGQETLPTLGNGTIGTASGTAGSNVISVSASVFDEDSVGQVLTLTWPEPLNKAIQLQITEVISATDVRVHLAASASYSNIPVSVTGCLFNLFYRQTAANWSTLPLPPLPTP
jgi:hypothetical protein